ncbi:MAG: phosphohydrolase [bacterium]|nr:phosphohydrolase [bacterium]
MNATVKKLWPELEWIEDNELREKTATVWEIALERSVLTAADLEVIPFTLKVSDCPVSFMAHKRTVVWMARDCGEQMRKGLKDALPIDMDTLVAGAILADVGKLLEYKLEDGEAVVGSYGKALRHPFSGVGLAMEAGLPPEVCHIIAAHAGEGDSVERSVEAYIVHHCDFMSFEPFLHLAK